MNLKTAIKDGLDKGETLFNKEISQLTESAAKKYFVLVKYFHQYAEGVTGANRNLSIMTNGGSGFNSKGEAQAAYKAKGFKDVKGKKDEGYGHVGATQYPYLYFRFRSARGS